MGIECRGGSWSDAGVVENGGEPGHRRDAKRWWAVATGTQTTLSAETTHVRVFYAFHPHHGLSLRVVRRPALGDGAVCVIEPTGRRLKIPRWMVSPECPDPIIVERAHLSQDALLSLTALLATHVGPEGHGRGTLPHANDDGGKGGHRAGPAAPPATPRELP